MHCERCGCEVDSSYLYCPDCGAKLSEEKKTEHLASTGTGCLHKQEPSSADRREEEASQFLLPKPVCKEENGQVFWSYCLPDGKEAHIGRYQWAGSFHCQEAIVCPFHRAGLVKTDLQGQIVKELGLSLVMPEKWKRDGILYIVQNQDGSGGLMDASGKIIQRPEKGRKLWPSEQNGVYFKSLLSEDGKESIGLISAKTGMEIIKPQYIQLEDLKGGYWKGIQKETGKESLLFIRDKKGRTLYTCDRLQSLAIEGYYSCLEDKKLGVIGPQGETVLPAEFESIEMLEEAPPRFLVCRKGRWGLLDRRAQMVLPVVYEALKPFGKGIFAAQAWGKWGVLEESGKILRGFVFDALPEKEEIGL